MKAVRSNVVMFVLLGLMGVIGITLVTRARTPHEVEPAASAEPVASTSAGTAASVSAAPATSGSANVHKPVKPTLARPLRVVGVSWESLAPALLHNGGLEPNADSAFGKAGLRVGIGVVDGAEGADQALARGGEEESGADVALVPLSAVVVSYERLRALDPVIFFVSHWSRGREQVLTRGSKSFDSLPNSGQIGLARAQSEAGTFVALFVLDAAGVPPARVTLLPEDDPKALVKARVSGHADKGRDMAQSEQLLSTGEASRLLPYVMIAQRGFIQQHAKLLRTFLAGWLKGQKQLVDDTAGAARRIAKLEGAPEPVTLLGGLGEIASVPLGENAELFGLSGRGAVTVERLLGRGFRLWRESKLSTVLPPETGMADGRVLAQLVRAGGAAPAGPRATAGDRDPKAVPLLVSRQSGTTLDEDALLSELGFLAGIFGRSPITLTVHRGGAVDKARSEALAQQATERFGLAQGRLLAGKARPRARSLASIEVFPVP